MPRSVQNVFDIAQAMHDANNLNRFGSWIVDNEVGINRPEFQRTICKILAHVSQARFLSEKYQASVNILENSACNCWTCIRDQVRLNLFQVAIR